MLCHQIVLEACKKDILKNWNGFTILKDGDHAL